MKKTLFLLMLMILITNNIVQSSDKEYVTGSLKFYPNTLNNYLTESTPTKIDKDGWTYYSSKSHGSAPWKDH